MKYLILLAASLLLGGCAVATRDVPAPAAPPASALYERQDTIALQDGEIRSLATALDQAERDRADLVAAGRARVLAVIAGILGLFAVLWGVLAFALSIDRGMFLSFAAGNAAMAVACLWLSEHATWLGPLGLGVIVASLIAVVWRFRRLHLAHMELASLHNAVQQRASGLENHFFQQIADLSGAPAPAPTQPAPTTPVQEHG